jgi:hypothetical protein
MMPQFLQSPPRPPVEEVLLALVLDALVALVPDVLEPELLALVPDVEEALLALVPDVDEPLEELEVPEPLDEPLPELLLEPLLEPPSNGSFLSTVAELIMIIPCWQPGCDWSPLQPKNCFMNGNCTFHG